MVQQNTPLLVLQHYIRAFNAKDREAMAACLAEEAFILGGTAPHVWHGPAAGQAWYADVVAEGERVGASDYVVTLGRPLHNNLDGDTAYIVAPVTLEFKLRGQIYKQTRAILTVALRQLSDEWRITAWAWAKGATTG